MSYRTYLVCGTFYWSNLLYLFIFFCNYFVLAPLFCILFLHVLLWIHFMFFLLVLHFTVQPSYFIVLSMVL